MHNKPSTVPSTEDMISLEVLGTGMKKTLHVRQMTSNRIGLPPPRDL